jgi:uncharacterized protein (TIGR02453 family)
MIASMPLDPHELATFLHSLSKNNNKIWFDEHRPQYQRLRTQFIDVVQDVIFGIAQFDPRVQDVRPEDGLFRINRDVRFSKDKSPYRTLFSAAISTHGRHGGMPVYYFHITEAGALFAAGGLYMPEPDKLALLRRSLVNRPAQFEALLKNKAFWKTFGAIVGEALKRVPKGFEDDAPHAEYLKLKSWTVGKETQLKKHATLDDDVLPFLTSTFRSMHPLIIWLREAVGA